MTKFIPKVILLGDEKDLPNDLPFNFEIVARPNFSLLFLNQFQKIKYDYILCTDWYFYYSNRKWLPLFIPDGMFATLAYFRNYCSNVGFVCDKNILQLMKIFKSIIHENRKGILDFDSYFYRGGYFFINENEMNPPPPLYTYS